MAGACVYLRLLMASHQRALVSAEAHQSTAQTEYINWHVVVSPEAEIGTPGYYTYEGTATEEEPPINQIRGMNGNHFQRGSIRQGLVVHGWLTPGFSRLILEWPKESQLVTSSLPTFAVT